MPGLVSSSKVTMPAIVKGTSRAQAGAVDAERAQAHFAYDEARAKLDAGFQQGLEVADAALAVHAHRASQSSSGGGGPIRARMPPMVKNSTAGLLTASAAAASASA